MKYDLVCVKIYGLQFIDFLFRGHRKGGLKIHIHSLLTRLVISWAYDGMGMGRGSGNGSIYLKEWKCKVIVKLGKFSFFNITVVGEKEKWKGENKRADLKRSDCFKKYVSFIKYFK